MTNYYGGSRFLHSGAPMGGSSGGHQGRIIMNSNARPRGGGYGGPSTGPGGYGSRRNFHQDDDDGGDSRRRPPMNAMPARGAHTGMSSGFHQQWDGNRGGPK